MEKRYDFKPQGVCSRMFHIVLDDGTIKEFEAEGGCNGNLKGLAVLVKGMPAEEAVQKLKGITCKKRPTSCPDQLALALEEMLEDQAT